MKLRPFQKKALLALENPKHVICVAPTGSGKSLIYEHCARKNVRMLLISPLRALAKQQFHSLKTQGVSVSPGVGPEGEPPPSGEGVWILSPEKLFYPEKPKTLRLLSDWNPDFLVVDECHCLWEWGSSFRPAFLELPKLLRRFSFSRSLWLTATLPHSARVQIRSFLPEKPEEIGRFRLSKTLFIQTAKEPLEDRLFYLKHWIDLQSGAGIVFVPTRSWSTKLERALIQMGISSVSYHAGMSTEEKEILENRIQEKKDRVIIATSAFGMGMDFKHLSWAVLWQPPLSLLSLVQAIGRVGRSQSVGRALIFWEEEDRFSLSWAIQESETQRKNLEEVFQFLKSKNCRVSQLEQWFDPFEKKYTLNCGRCEWCLTNPANSV